MFAHDIPAFDAPPAQYQPLLAAIIEDLDKMLADGKELPPLGFVCKAGKIEKIVVSNFSDAREKDYFAESVRQFASKCQADAVALVSEAWTLAIAGKSADEVAAIRHRYPQVSDSPDAVSSVLVQLQTYDGHWLGMAPLANHDGQPRTAGAWQWCRPEGGAGRFAYLLPRRYATAAQQEAYLLRARALFAAAGLDADRPLISGESVLDIIKSYLPKAPPEALANDKLIDDIIAAAVRMGMAR